MTDDAGITLSIFDVIKIVGNGLGVATFKEVAENLKGRSDSFKRIKHAYRGKQGFSSAWLWIFLFLIPRLVELLAGAAVVVALTVLTTAFPSSSQWLETFLGSNIATHISTIGWVGLGVSLLAGVVLVKEPEWSYRFLRHWLALKGETERLLAYRAKRGEKGIFKVAESRCDELAGCILAKLEEDKDWVTGALIDHRPNDADTVANELFLGSIFEVGDYKTFGGTWENFKPIQDFKLSGRPICSPSNLDRLSVDELLNELENFFSDRGNRLKRVLVDDLRSALATLKNQYGGNVRRALERLRRPRRFRLALSFLSVAVAATLLARVPQLASWAAQAGSVIYALWAIAVLGLLWTLARDWHEWWLWSRARLRLVNDFELIQDRLRVFELFERKRSLRLAFTKFAFEFGLVDFSEQQLRLGAAGYVGLALLKTGAVWTKDVEKVRAADRGLVFFSEQAMRRIADTYRGRVVRAGAPAKSLKGEHSPYNVIDGFLYLVGHKYCKHNHCGTVAEPECPFAKTKLCDSFTSKGFIYEWEDREFVLRKLEGETRDPELAH